MLRSLRIVKFLHNAYNSVLCGSCNEIVQRINNDSLHRQMISVSAICRIDLTIAGEQVEEKKKAKTPRIPKITLIYPDESVTVTYLEEAEKIAARRKFKLIKMHTDPKSNRDVYKLYNNKKFIDIQGDTPTGGASKSYVKMKSTKLFPIQSKINEHDLETKINHINKLLVKRHRIKLLLISTGEEREKTKQIIMQKVKGNVAEERPKHNNVILVYHPLPDQSNCAEENIGKT